MKKTKAIVKKAGEDSRCHCRSGFTDAPGQEETQEKTGYTVTIEEHISESFTVEARDIVHALDEAERQYTQGLLIVQPSIPLSRQIMARNDETGETTGWREF